MSPRKVAGYVKAVARVEALANAIAKLEDEHAVAKEDALRRRMALTGGELNAAVNTLHGGTK